MNQQSRKFTFTADLDTCPDFHVNTYKRKIKTSDETFIDQILRFILFCILILVDSVFYQKY